MRPMPAITTRGVSESISRRCGGTAIGSTRFFTRRAHISSSSGVSAMDRVMVNTCMSYSRVSNKP
ncbi:hypothetical protein D3C80_2136690 [compost metagenome]